MQLRNVRRVSDDFFTPRRRRRAADESDRRKIGMAYFNLNIV